METTDKMPTHTSLFQVFLRLRPPQTLLKQQTEQWLIVEPPTTVTEDSEEEMGASHPTHITLQPPYDSRKRAIERFGFTKIFREESLQSDIFKETGTAESIKTLVQDSRDGLVATLGVTGSGKSHTILGTKSQRGLTQMTLDVLYASIGSSMRCSKDPSLILSLQGCDSSEAQIIPANTFLEMVYGDGERARVSRAQTPMTGYGSRAQTPMEASGSHHSRKPAMPQPANFPKLPDVSAHTFEIDQGYDYTVLVSMYEVYNDRIFDLLSNTAAQSGTTMNTRQGTALQKSLMRRPLLFKNTEMSPDRKVVAGLRKVVCGSYEEAMTVLETGLMERRVAGTGSNSVSSRSHGFFCVEVKKTLRGRYCSADDWTGATLSIVDLAGSERARNAKTTGSTLAEAGKINESLMYLGQCLQVQSDCQQDGSKPIVPFRQCKLTELLFSNSFPTSTNTTTVVRQPQKAVMVVTADPQGDFNATSQILRYSALAREVTVPRIPSVTSTIVNGSSKNNNAAASGRATPHEHYFSAQELEHATNEVRRLAEECEGLAVRLTEEEIRRTEAELRLQAVEERLAITEQDTREECWQEMEIMMEEEKTRWRAAWDEEKQKGEDYLDGKINILEKSSQFQVYSATSSDDRSEELERENEALRAKLRALEQELHVQSPTKSKKTNQSSPSKKLMLHENSNTNTAANPFLNALKARDSGSALKLKKHTEESVDPFEISPRKLSLRSSNATRIDDVEQQELPGTTKKTQRKLTTRRWDLGDADVM